MNSIRSLQANNPDALSKLIGDELKKGWTLITITSIYHPMTGEKHFAWLKK
ncbi:MAG: hypothetical protein K8E24_002560 [Methanobacterium paludis]|nr:hypothetical protein [Methanobacterium paludis]